MRLIGKRLSLAASFALVCLAAPFVAGAQAATFEFPSASSSVVSNGTAPAGQVGYFWSVARGDKVSQTFASLPYIDHVALAVQAPSNLLSPGAEVDWTLSLNGTDVGSFAVPAATTTPILLEQSFAPIAGPLYAVVLRETNEVASGQGSITLAASDGAGAHSLEMSNVVAPDTVINSGPIPATTATAATFAFASPEKDATGFVCALDHAPFTPCASPKEYAALALGAHSLEVAAVDSAGNTDPTPATWQWVVVAPPPPHKAAPKKCKRGYKKVKKHGKAVCVKKKHHKPHHRS